MVLAPPVAIGSSNAFALPLSFLLFGVVHFVGLNLVFALGLSAISLSWFRQPWALVSTHLFTLGYVSAIIMGAGYQLVPVILETRLWSLKLGYWHLALYAAGVPILLASFWRLSSPWLVAGGTLVAVAVALFLVNMAATMRKARHWHHSATFLICSLVYPAAVVTLGLALAVNLRTGYLGASTRGHLVIHALFGFGGWFTLTIMGVAYRLVPLFTLSHHQPGARTWATLALTNAGILAMATAAGFGAGQRWLAAGLAVAGAGVAAFLLEMHQVLRKRVRKDLEPGMQLTRTAFAFLAVTLALLAIYLAAPADFATPARTVGLVYVAAMGWVALVVTGQMYKIVPFLVWTWRYAPRAGKESVPLLRDMVDPRVARWAGWLLVGGTALVVAGLWLPWLPLAATGALANALGALLFAWNMADILRR